MSADERDQWTIFHFSQANPAGAGQGKVPALLRRVADTLDELGEIEVQDIAFQSETGFGEVADHPDDARVSVTVYYQRHSDSG